MENAVKYSNPGSEIIISARELQESVVVDVRDKGFGIPADELEKVFDKFYKIRFSESAFTGTGLGLALCKAIVEAHDARIEALLPDDGEQGTLLRITFPSNVIYNIKPELIPEEVRDA